MISDIPAGDGKTANSFLQCTLSEYKSFKSQTEEGKERGAKKKERKGTGPNQTDCAEIYSSSGIRMGRERGNVFILTHLQDFVKLLTTNSLPEIE